MALTLKLSVEINLSSPVAEALIKNVLVDKASLDKLKAAILPPSNNTEEPVICPLSFNIKLSFVEFNCVDANSKPPIVPPLNNTCDPVMSPLAFILKLFVEIILLWF